MYKRRGMMLHKYHRLGNKNSEVEVECEANEEEMDGALQLLSFGPPRERNVLDERGVLLLNTPIDQKTVAYFQYRLWSYHFDEDFTDDIQILINSPGGHADAGWALIDTMCSIKNNVKTIAVGEICSMATMIFVAGDERVMSPNSCAMLHEFSTMNYGTRSDLVAARKGEEMEWDREVRHLINYSKYTCEDEIKKHLLQDHDLWLTPTEMKKHGLADKISKPRQKIGKKKSK